MIGIQIWADFVCPYSYIGVHNLRAAITRLGIQQVDYQFNSYLHYPFVSKNAEETLSHYISNKYGISDVEAEKYMQDVSNLAQQYDIPLHVENLKPINTFTAHRLLKLATNYQLQMAFYEALSKAYFIDGQLIDEHDLLLQLSIQVGLPQKEVQKTLLNSAAFEEDVERDFFKKQQLQIEGTPYFVFNDEVSVAGIQSVTAFEQLLQSLSEN